MWSGRAAVSQCEARVLRTNVATRNIGRACTVESEPQVNQMASGSISLPGSVIPVANLRGFSLTKTSPGQFELKTKKRSSTFIASYCSLSNLPFSHITINSNKTVICLALLECSNYQDAKGGYLKTLKPLWIHHQIFLPCSNA